jgi:hypothetical protein
VFAGPGNGTQKLIEDLKSNICGGDVGREVVEGSLEAHLMKNFGAVQIGRHRFYRPKSNEPPGEARFIHLWRYKEAIRLADEFAVEPLLTNARFVASHKQNRLTFG